MNGNISQTDKLDKLDNGAAKMRAKLLLGLLLTLQGQATEIDTIAKARYFCKESELVPLVTNCAKQSMSFLDCVGVGTPGPSRQCDCIIQNDQMQECFGSCLEQVYDLLCHRTWQPRKNPLGTSG